MERIATQIILAAQPRKVPPKLFGVNSKPVSFKTSYSLPTLQLPFNNTTLPGLKKKKKEKVKKGNTAPKNIENASKTCNITSNLHPQTKNLLVPSILKSL